MKRLARYDEDVGCHFITTVTRHRTQVFQDDGNIRLLIDTVSFYRQRRDFRLLGYVFMPDHFHLLVVPEKGRVCDIMRNIKSYSANRIRHRMQLNSRIWQSGFHDHVVASTWDLEAKLDYMHMNPLRKGLVADPESYPYSSYRNLYAGGEPVLQIDLL